jgi:hypothetical integral membrane protein (TIGR02206 family)
MGFVNDASSMNPIRLFGPSHLAALAATVVIGVLLWLLVRWQSPWSRRAEVVLAGLLLSQWLVRIVVAKALGYLDPQTALPFHLCDVVSVITGIALLKKTPLLIEISYFWGMAGTLNGVLTPNLAHDFPHPEYFAFFLLHSGVVIAALHMTIAWKVYPRLKSVWWSWLWIQLYLAVAALVNWLADANYAFLHHRPANASLLDVLPDPPRHLLVLEPLALTLFFLLYLPFHRLPAKGKSTSNGKISDPQ